MQMTTRILMVSALMLTSVSAPAGQTAATQRVMREKLVHTQGILRAIMVSDHQLLEKESVALMRLTKEDGWQVLTSPEYLRQSAAFTQAIEDLVDAAKGNDLDGAAVSYSAMTMRCYQCHRYLKGQRRADR
jgi:hypothetical protein